MANYVNIHSIASILFHRFLLFSFSVYFAFAKKLTTFSVLDSNEVKLYAISVCVWGWRL